MTNAGNFPADEVLSDVTTWPGEMRGADGRPVPALIWQPHMQAIEFDGADTVNLVVRDLLQRGLHLVIGALTPATFGLAMGWRATVEQDQVEVRDADGKLAVSMESTGPDDDEWRRWHQLALDRREVWVAAGPQIADPRTGMPDLVAARRRGQLVIGAVPVQHRRGAQ